MTISRRRKGKIAAAVWIRRAAAAGSG